MATVRRMKLGSQGMEVSAQGLGCMGMSQGYGPPKPDDEMIQLIHHAISSGVTFLDSSDAYGDNELLLAKVTLHTYPPHYTVVIIITSFYFIITGFEGRVERESGISYEIWDHSCWGQKADSGRPGIYTGSL